MRNVVHSFTPCVLAGIMLIGAGGTASSQCDTAAIAAMAANVRHLLETENLQDAVRVLESASHDCLQPGRSATTMAVVNFYFGLTYDHRANVAPEKKAENRTLAEKFYSRALGLIQNAPSDEVDRDYFWATIGYPDGAIVLFKRAAEADSLHRLARLLAVVDVLDDVNRGEEARRLNEELATRYPTSEAIWYRVLKHDREDLTRNPENLASPARHMWDLWKVGLTAVALEACEQLIGASAGRDPWLTERAFLQWVEAQALNRALTLENLRKIQAVERWDPARLRELQGLLLHPRETASSLRWWNQTRLRTHVISAVLECVGLDLLRKGDSRGARDVLELALDVSPPFYEYTSEELRDRKEVYLDVSTELASLYHKYPDLDPDTNRFRQLESRLFGGKQAAYESNDREAILRFHTVLGLIYAEKGRWTSFGYTNAIFQLEHALQLAKSGMGESVALPHLQRLLAEGYATVDNPQKAFNAYLEAAEGYLDVDEVDAASRMLKLGRANTLTDTLLLQNNRRLRFLESIVKVRRDVSLLDDVSSHQKAVELLSGSEALRVESVDYRQFGSDSLFVKRQRFKVYADLTDRMSPTDTVAAAKMISKEVARQLQEEIELKSPGDVARAKAAVPRSETPSTTAQKVQKAIKAYGTKLVK